MIYTGIGPLIVPAYIAEHMRAIGYELGRRGHTLYSGGASGSDMAFEHGCGTGDKKIFLPWSGFNDNRSSYFGVTPEALAIAEKYHPAWDKCNRTARLFHARNVFQIFGWDLKTPTKMVITYQPGDEWTGGTSQALRMADANNIEIYNLWVKVNDMRINVIIHDIVKRMENLYEKDRPLPGL